MGQPRAARPQSETGQSNGPNSKGISKERNPARGNAQTSDRPRGSFIRPRGFVHVPWRVSSISEILTLVLDPWAVARGGRHDDGPMTVWAAAGYVCLRLSSVLAFGVLLFGEQDGLCRVQFSNFTTGVTMSTDLRVLLRARETSSLTPLPTRVRGLLRYSS